MLTRRLKIAGTISFLGTGVCYLAQYIATPIAGNLDGSAVLAKVAAHSAGMGWALALDVPTIVFATTALLFLGHLVRARTSVLGGIAFVLLFVPFLVSIPALVGFDLLASVATDAKVLDAWQASTFYNATVLPYLLTHIVGFILAAIAVFRSRAVPRWATIALAVWPIIETVTYGVGKPGVLVAYLILLIGYLGCALSLTRSSRDATEQSETAYAAA